MARMFVESLSIFVLSIVALAMIHVIANANTGRANGIGWLNEKGFVLMGVGILYLAVGLILTRLRR